MTAVASYGFKEIGTVNNYTIIRWFNEMLLFGGFWSPSKCSKRNLPLKVSFASLIKSDIMDFMGPSSVRRNEGESLVAAKVFLRLRHYCTE